MITTAQTKVIVATAIRAHVGLGPSRRGGHSFDSLASVSGLKPDRIRKLADPYSGVQCHAGEIFTLITHLPPSFANMVMEPLGKGGAHDLGHKYPAFALPSAAGEFAYNFNQRLYDDGRFCNRDALEMLPIARTVHEYAGAFILQQPTEKVEG